MSTDLVMRVLLNPNLIPILILSLVFCVLLLGWISRRRLSNNIEKNFAKIREEIRFSVQPMADIPQGVEEIADLAGEVWKIEQRLAKISDDIPETHRRGMENSVQRLRRYLEKFDVETQDYTGQKYNDGLNLDVLQVEHDPTVTLPIIKETKEPTIICRGRVVKKAKVIIATNQLKP